MNTDVEFHIRQNYTWSKLPGNVKQLLGNSQKEYEKCVVKFSVKNQLRYKGNLVRHIKKDEKHYYEEVLTYSRSHLMLYPYHLSDVIVKGLRVTPFQYYISIMESIMEQEKSYDSLPNFTAADCLRLLGIGRNQYIDLMNQCRSGRKLFRKKNIRDLLPAKPMCDMVIEPWWMVQVGNIVEEDMKMVTEGEKIIIDNIIDNRAQIAGDLHCRHVHSLYGKGLVYFDVPIEDEDCIIVSTLEGFVMNRVLGDYFETLLYKIFVSIDEHTTVAELATVLQIDARQVKNGVSLYCRLGFARRKGQDMAPEDLHPSWLEHTSPLKKRNLATTSSTESDNMLLLELDTVLGETLVPSEETSSGAEDAEPGFLVNQLHAKRIAFLFDSTLTAYLMMGNLSPGLKSHAVTMFEVGKLSDESLDSLLLELDKISTDDSEGEAQRYFDHALALHRTILFLRHNRDMARTEEDNQNLCLGIDLIRCESLQSLEPATCSRLLNKNYSLLVSMAPLSNEIRPVSSSHPPHLGPAIPEVNSIWFKLFIYHLTGFGPPTLLLAKGMRLKRIPECLQMYDRLLVTTWGHDPGEVPATNVLMMLNEALLHSAVLVQAYGMSQHVKTVHVPFPLEPVDMEQQDEKEQRRWFQHPAVLCLGQFIDLEHSCGFITMVNLATHASNNSNKGVCGMSHSNSSRVWEWGEQWTPLTLKDEVPKQPPCGKQGRVDSQSLPTNGIKNSVCAEILEEELDRLDSDIIDVNCAAVKSKRERWKQRPESLKLNLENASSGNFWTLLDCNYGVPLFESKINERISRRIVTCGLWKQDNLEKLTYSSRKLCLRLLDFISQYQELPVASETVNGGTKKSMCPEISLPSQNLLFNGQELKYWNGK